MDTDQVSHTAWLVFACQLRLKQMARWSALVPDEDAAFYRRCYDYCRQHFPRYRYLHYLLPLRPCIALVDLALARGASLHFVLRKQAVAKQADMAIAAGARQLVVVGGGFDLLALKYARANKDLQCFELDMPAMHGHKTAIVDAHFGQRPANVHFISVDLSQQALSEVLAQQPAFRTDLPTLFVAEGVLMYLPEASVHEFFAQMVRACKADISVVFTAIESRKKKQTGTSLKLRHAILSASRERFAWSMDEEKIEAFLHSMGWRQRSRVNYADLQRPYRKPEEMPIIERQNGEYLVAASAMAYDEASL